MKLNANQEKFANLIFEGIAPSEAFKQCWKWENHSKQAIATDANRRLNNPKIAARIDELKAKAAKNSMITVESLIAELEEARDVAKEEGQSSAMVSATMGKAKLTGLDKQIIEVSGKNGGAIETVSMSPEDYRKARQEMLNADDC